MSITRAWSDERPVNNAFECTVTVAAPPQLLRHCYKMLGVGQLQWVLASTPVV